MSTKKEEQKSKPKEKPPFPEGYEPTDKSNTSQMSNAGLECKLEKEKEERQEERFLWIMAVMLLLDVLFLGSMKNTTAPIVIGLVELILVVVIAQRLGVDAVSILVDKMLNSVGNNKNDK